MTSLLYGRSLPKPDDFTSSYPGRRPLASKVLGTTYLRSSSSGLIVRPFKAENRGHLMGSPRW
jgi:hypothetical protein